MKQLELKPCPFCGGEAEFIQDRVLGLYAVWCKKCKCQTTYQFDFCKGLGVSKHKAAEAWNNRAGDERNDLLHEKHN